MELEYPALGQYDLKAQPASRSSTFNKPTYTCRTQEPGANHHIPDRRRPDCWRDGPQAYHHTRAGKELRY